MVGKRGGRGGGSDQSGRQSAPPRHSNSRQADTHSSGLGQGNVPLWAIINTVLHITSLRSREENIQRGQTGISSDFTLLGFVCVPRYG